MSSTTPTRKPPARTSLPFTSLAAFGSSALSLYVGTNGRPWLALYEMNTAMIATSTVTAPIRTGLAASCRRAFLTARAGS